MSDSRIFNLGKGKEENWGEMEASRDAMASEAMEDADKALRTPPARRRRLPRALGGTQLAKERKKALNSLRQKRRRARLREEGARVAGTDSDEGMAAEVPLPDQEELPYDPRPRSPVGGHFEAEDLNAREAALVNRRETVTEPQQSSYKAPANPAREKMELLGKEFTSLKVTSNISDAALDRVFHIIMEYSDVVKQLVDTGEMAPTYTTGLRPSLTEQLLPVRNSLLLKINRQGQRPLYKKLTDLPSIPQEYLNLQPHDTTKLLRIDSGVRLTDVKEFYFSTHGGKSETLLQHTRNCSLSVDGVQESKSGSRTFTVVSVKFGTCVYLLRIFNTLIGVDESKPSAKEILRFVGNQ